MINAGFQFGVNVDVDVVVVGEYLWCSNSYHQLIRLGILSKKWTGVHAGPCLLSWWRGQSQKKWSGFIGGMMLNAERLNHKILQERMTDRPRWSNSESSALSMDVKKVGYYRRKNLQAKKASCCWADGTMIKATIYKGFSLEKLMSKVRPIPQ